MSIPSSLLLFTTIAICFSSSSCSNGDPVRPIVASNGAPVVSTDATAPSQTPRKPFSPPTLSTHQVYLVAREYCIKDKLIFENDSFELSMRYKSEDKEWSVQFTPLPHRDGNFCWVIISDKEAKVIRVDHGE